MLLHVDFKSSEPLKHFAFFIWQKLHLRSHGYKFSKGGWDVKKNNEKDEINEVNDIFEVIRSLDLFNTTLKYKGSS